MKKAFTICILGVLLLSANQVFALTYKDATYSEKNSFSVSDASLSEAKLLQKYVLRYQEKINTLYASYNNNKSQIIEDANTILEKMSESLLKVQEKSIGEDSATQIMKSIVDDLKILNERMKIYLDQEKEIYEMNLQKQKKQFLIVGRKISSILDSLINKISAVLIKKSQLSSSEKKIVESLVKIREENDKIKNFENEEFSSIEEIQSYFKNIIKNVREEILNIKKLSR